MCVIIIAEMKIKIDMTTSFVSASRFLIRFIHILKILQQENSFSSSNMQIIMFVEDWINIEQVMPSRQQKSAK